MPDLKEKDMERLAQAFFANLQRDNCEYGAIGLDCKRPFGNSDVEGDILDIIYMTADSESSREYAASLYDNLIPWLQQKYIKGVK